MNAEKSNKLSKAKAKLKKVSDSYDEEILHENFDDAAKLEAFCDIAWTQLDGRI